MGAKTTSYIDAQGLKRTGYIIDGRTYEDAGATTPVGKGSIVEAGGKRYVKGVGEKGGSMLYSDYLSSQNMKATDYVDSQGTVKTGYIKGGKTYADILATTPIEKGSMVSAGGHTWVKGENGESMLYSDYLKSLETGKGETSGEGNEDALSRMEAAAKEEYDKKISSNDSFYAAQLQRSDAEAARLKEGLEEEYALLGKQLYRDYMMDKKNLPQLLAAQGISGGLSESSLVGLGADYQSQLSENERRKFSAMQDVDAATAETRMQLLFDKAEADAKAEEDYAEKQMELVQRREKQAAEAAEKAAASEKLLYTRALEKAEALADLGDFSGYRALGYSEAEVAAMEKAYNEKQFATRLKIAQQKARYGDASELLALLGM